MKIRQIVLASITVMLLSTSNVWAERYGSPKPKHNGREHSSIARAPEIDAASGTSAIALLTGVLLLVGERSRTRRS